LEWKRRVAWFGRKVQWKVRKKCIKLVGFMVGLVVFGRRVLQRRVSVSVTDSFGSIECCVPMASSNSTQQDVNKPAKRKPVFTKVDQLKPGTNGHTLVAKVLSSDTVVHKPRPSSAHNIKPTVIAECLIGDDTGTIIFTARNEQGTPISPTHLCKSYSFLLISISLLSKRKLFTWALFYLSQFWVFIFLLGFSFCDLHCYCSCEIARVWCSCFNNASGSMMVVSGS